MKRCRIGGSENRLVTEIEDEAAMAEMSRVCSIRDWITTPQQKGYGPLLPPFRVYLFSTALAFFGLLFPIS